MVIVTMTIGRLQTNLEVVKQDTKNRWKNPWEKKPGNVFSKPMLNHLNLWSLKVDNNTITLNIIYKYTDVRKNYPEQSSQVADCNWRQMKSEEWFK